MYILVATNHFVGVKNLMRDLCDRLSVFADITINYRKHTIQIKNTDIYIEFRPAFAEKIIGLRPDYYWADSYDVNDYFKYRPNTKELKTFTEIENVVLDELSKMESE